MTNSSALEINCALYVITLVLYYYKKRTIDLAFICITMFSISSIGSIIYYSFPEIEIGYSNVTLKPLIYVYVLFLIIVFPLAKLKLADIKQFNVSFKYLELFSLVFIVASIPVFFNLIIDLFTQSFAGNYFALMYDNDSDNSKLLLIPAVQPFYAVIRRFYDIVVVLFLLNILKGNKRYSYLLFLSILTFFIMPFLSGSRGGIVISAMKLVGYYIVFSALYPQKIRRLFKVTGIVTLSLLIMLLAVISISRFNDKAHSGSYMIQQWVSLYLGEGFIRFSDVLWDIQRTLDGDKNFPFLKSLLGFDVILDNDKAIEVYSAYLGAKTDVFYTFVGSFYIDFGRKLNVVWFMLLSFISYLIVRTINRTKSINFLQIFYIVYLYNLIATGFTANPYAISHTQRDITFQWVLILIIYIISRRTPKRQF